MKRRKRRHIRVIRRIIVQPEITIQPEKTKEQSFSWLLLPSVLGILLCCFCLAGLTWAWFSNSVTSSANNITTASFAVDISVKTNGTELTPTEENGKYTYTLTAGTTYAVTVTADNTATATTGYCTVKLVSSDNNEKTYHTVQLYPAGGDGKPQSVQFTVQHSDASYLTITPQWGTYAKPDAEALIGNSTNDINAIPPQFLSTLEAETGGTGGTSGTEETQKYQLTDSEQSYTVQSGDTLSTIAEKFGTTVDVLTAYNSIANPDTIQTGSTVKIPPASYKIPAADSPTDNSQTSTENTSSEPPATETPSQPEESSSTETSSQETASVETSSSETSGESE